MGTDINDIDEDIESILRENDHKLFFEDVSSWLKVCLNGDKHSINQATFIKDLRWDLSIATCNIWRAYNVSP